MKIPQSSSWRATTAVAIDKTEVYVKIISGNSMDRKQSIKLWEFAKRITTYAYYQIIQ